LAVKEDLKKVMSAVEMWSTLERLAGNPDYAVCVMTWPWPDGGWMAGIALHDQGWAERQGMPQIILDLLEERIPVWNMYDGFANGINAHSTDGPGAVKELAMEIARRGKKQET
jgi:hypothetical protein